MWEDKQSCHQVGFRKTCTIKHLSMNCYKLWLEVPSPLGPILSRPVYLTPRDHGEDQSGRVGLQSSTTQNRRDAS